MKKTFAVIAAVLFVLSFAASAFAIHAEIPSETQAVVGKGSTQITIGGEIRVRGWLRDNFAQVADQQIDNYYVDVDNSSTDVLVATKTTNNKFWNGQTTLVMPWNKNFTEYQENYWKLDSGWWDVEFEKKWHKTVWKDKVSDATSHAFWDQRVRLYVDAKISPNVQGYVMLESGSKDSDTWKWGFTDATTTTASTAGRKPTDLNILEAWILYKGSGLFGFNSGIKVGHMPLALGEKLFFDHTKFGDDAFVFFMDPTKELHVGFVTIKLAENMGSTGSGTSYLNNNDDIDAYVALATYQIANYGMIGMNYTYINWSDMELSFQNLGLHTKGKFGPVGLKAEVDFQFGDLGAANADFGGYAFMAGLNYDMKPINLRAAFAYGSGDADTSNGKIKEFQTALGNDIHSTFIHEFMITGSSMNQIVAAAGGTGGRASGTNTGLANLTQYNLGVDYAATKDLNLNFDLFFLRASETPKHSGVSKDLGWEVDFMGTYAIAKNLNYFLRAGYFKPGAFYNPENWIGSSDADCYDVNKKAVTMVMHGIQLSF